MGFWFTVRKTLSQSSSGSMFEGLRMGLLAHGGCATPTLVFICAFGAFVVGG